MPRYLVVCILQLFSLALICPTSKAQDGKRSEDASKTAEFTN